MCHLQIGKEKKVAVVLACPGQEESLLGTPAAGATGKNLKVLLDLLSHRLGRPDLIRQNITITNSSVRPIYQAQDGDSEPTPAEVKDPKNICRVYEELREVTDFVLFSGTSAKTLMDKLCLPNNPTFIPIPHLGLRGLNQIKLDEAEGQKAGGTAPTDESKTRRRLEIVADNVTRLVAQD